MMAWWVFSVIIQSCCGMLLVRTRSIPQQDWMITENTHQAIISREIYSAVQNICMQETAKHKGKEKRL